MKLSVTNRIEINATTAAVWDALINPEQTKKYMFGCETVSDWKVGSPLLWKGLYEGNEMVFVKGFIVKIQPEKQLIYTTIDPNNTSIPDLAENYLTVIYDIATADGKTILTATQGDYATVADGENRYKHTLDGGGWQPILEQIKTMLEGI